MNPLLITLLMFGPRFGTTSADIPPQFKSAYRVYLDLANAIGRQDVARPEFVPVTSTSDVARMYPNGKLVVTTKFLEICRGLGRDSLDAMALVIGHELAHYYNRHLWALDFGSADFGSSTAKVDWGANLDPKWRRSIDSIWAHRTDSLAQADFVKKKSELENEADEFGMFFGFVAGYRPFDAAERFFPALYKAMSWADSLPGYKPKQERISIARKSAQRVEKLAEVFKTGNILMALAGPDKGSRKAYLLNRAGLCFQYIIQQGFASREIYNNAAACRMEEAMSYLKEMDMLRFSYPTVADAESRLLTNKPRETVWVKGTTELEEAVKQLLDEAETSLNRAIQLDKEYVPAYINLATVKALQHQPDDAAFYAGKSVTKAEASGNTLLFSYALEITAIIQAGKGESKEARKTFERARDLGCPLSESNLLILAGKPLPEPGKPASFNLDEEETVNNRTVYELYRQTLELQSDPRYTKSISERMNLVNIPQADGTFSVMECAGGSGFCKDLMLFETNEHYTSATAGGIKRGASLDQVENSYGSPAGIFTLATATYHVYLDRGIVFQADASGAVTGWVVFDWK